jgi:hypothetical protein
MRRGGRERICGVCDGAGDHGGEVRAGGAAPQVRYALVRAALRQQAGDKMPDGADQFRGEMSELD